MHKKIRIAIISDLHCHQLEKHKEEINYESKNGFYTKIQESYILTDANLPIYQDPYKSFVKLIEKSNNKGINLDVDFLLMPGDFGNKSCPIGIEKGWEITKDIGKLLNAKSIISTIGNHDVNSRQIFGDDPFCFTKDLLPIYPSMSDDEKIEYQTYGYVIKEYENCRFLVINTVHKHINKYEADHGLFSEESLVNLKERLEEFKEPKLGIAICHHSPMEHSRVGSKNVDLMFNGDQLISLLDLYNFEVIIHGHKHDPLLRYGGGSGDSSLIFSSGSFSAIKNLLLPVGINTFHIMELNINENARSKGIIETWYFIPTQGWKNELPNPYINNKVGFGYRTDIKEKVSSIYDFMVNSSKPQLNYLSEFIIHFEELQYLIPIDFEKLITELKNKNILITKGIINEETKIEIKK